MNLGLSEASSEINETFRCGYERSLIHAYLNRFDCVSRDYSNCISNSEQPLAFIRFPTAAGGIIYSKRGLKV